MNYNQLPVDDELFRARRPIVKSKTLRIALFLLATATLFAEDLKKPDVPPELLPNDNEALVLMAHGKGDQIYVCKANVNGAQFGYLLQAPDAVLTDDAGKEVGHHFIGPTWQWSDDSKITGKVVISARSPDPQAISWLLLSTVDHSDIGLLAHVTSILRINTKGGRAPSSGCDAGQLGKEVRIPYSADYYFYARQYK
jgi:Protein of unknown function (DUF3455)